MIYLNPQYSSPRQKNIVLITTICSCILGVLVWSVGVRPFTVTGLSMFPAFNKTFVDGKSGFLSGDYLFIDLFSYIFIQDPERFDVIVAHSPIQSNKFILKRIIGLPGETLTFSQNSVTLTPVGGEPFILSEPYVFQPHITVYDQKEITLQSEEYFIMGDNRMFSLDSRSWGPLPSENIVGRVLARLYPFEEIALFPQ